MADLDDVADLLAWGFAGRSPDYWMDGLRRISVCETPEAFPRFGYMLDYDGRPVGALLSIYTARGRALPFVLQPMRVRQIRLPAMQMIYCPDVADYVACAGEIDRFLLPRGRISVALDANGRVEDLVGPYREPLGRKYFKGPQRPRLADLTDTELVLYGP
jgi:hypothetical protein